MLTPPPSGKAVSVEWFDVDARSGIRITGTFDVSLAVTGESDRPAFQTIEREIEASRDQTPNLTTQPVDAAPSVWTLTDRFRRFLAVHVRRCPSHTHC